MVWRALPMALLCRGPKTDGMGPSDRGVRQASQAMRERLQRQGVTMRLPKPGRPVGQDDEGALLQVAQDRVDRRRLCGGRRNQLEVFKDIEMFYNSRRWPSALGDVPPDGIGTAMEKSREERSSDPFYRRGVE